MDGNQWNKTGTEVGSIEGENIECLTNHLSSFTMVVLEGKVYCDRNENLLIFFNFRYCFGFIFYRFISSYIFVFYNTVFPEQYRC